MADHKKTTYIYGKQAVSEALRSALTSVQKVFLTHQFADPALVKLIASAGVPSVRVEADQLPGRLDGVNHQGVVVAISSQDLLQPYRQFIAELKISPATLLILLDELADPQNVGAIIRSAAAFGAAGVLIPEHREAPVTGAVIKVSAGMAFQIPLITIGNINQTIRDLKERDFWIYGLEGGAPNTLEEQQFDTPTVVVVGNEGQGIRLKTKESCDVLVSIPINPQCESLNVAASAAVALYAWSRWHPPGRGRKTPKARG